MSAELLRKASEQVRLDIEDVLILDHETAHALADWLDAETEHVAGHYCEAHCEYPDGSPRCRAALAVARLIVGEQS